MIKIQKISKQYKDAVNNRIVPALETVSFEVAKGEFVSILGPSGCGKSTLINIIAGFIPPSEGCVYFNGEKAMIPSPDRIVVFQEHNLLPWKNVAQNIGMGLKAKRASRRDRRDCAQKYVDFMCLNGFEESYPYQLSGGMKQRVALARALAVEPQCILMDEPLGSLDLQIREKLQTEISTLWIKTKKTVLMVTHDIEEAVFLSQRVIVMSKLPGKVKEIIPVPIPFPRDPAIKMTRKFQEIKGALWETVMQ